MKALENKEGGEAKRLEAKHLSSNRKITVECVLEVEL